MPCLGGHSMSGPATVASAPNSLVPVPFTHLLAVKGFSAGAAACRSAAFSF